MALRAALRCGWRTRRRSGLGSAWRLFSTEDNEDNEGNEDLYLEQKQLRDIKSEEFYDQHGHERRYFYYIDLQGRLFLENTRPKNIATCLKSAKFLRFFFSQVRPNERDPNAAETPAELESVLQEYPYRSPCGKEMNFIKCADKPLVFDDLRREESGDGELEGHWLLSYGGGELSVPFAPDRLRISLSTGRLYHELQTKHMTLANGHGLALIRSQLAVVFGNTITLHDDQDQDTEDEDRIIGDFEWEGQLHPVRAVR